MHSKKVQFHLCYSLCPECVQIVTNLLCIVAKTCLLKKLSAGFLQKPDLRLLLPGKPLKNITLYDENQFLVV
jgi:hypothetical protein